MAKTKISEFSATPANNTDIDGINIAEGCAPSGINDAIRELMAQLKDWQSGTSNDPYVIGSSGSLTLNQGTANGVAYLNGSKVLTTGSELTFDGSQLDVPAGSASAPSLSTTADANTGIYFPAADVVGISTGGTERARVDASGNLGLGVTPSAWASTWKAMQIADGASLVGRVGSITQVHLGANCFFDGAWKYLGTGLATNYYQDTGTHVWRTAGSGTAGNAISFTQAMTLDASGNLGVGTTSPLIASGYTNLVVSNATNGGILYVDRPSGARGYFYANATTSVILGTAGSYPLVFNTADTERARIDSSGNVGIGTSSPARPFHVASSATSYIARFQNSGSALALINFKDSTTGDFDVGIGANGANLVAYTANTERARIDSSGNLLVGTTSARANSRLNVNGGINTDDGVIGYLTSDTFTLNSKTQPSYGFNLNPTGSTPIGISGYYGIAFATTNTERARIDSSGNLLVGTTSALDGGVYKLQIRHDGARAIVTETTGTSISYAAVFRNGNGTVGNINTNGTATSYATSSDYRLKNTIAPMTGALAKVAALKPCTYKWNADGSDGEGFIAHELAEVVPQCVTGEKDAVDADGNPQYQGIDTSFLVATLTAAIQEQQAIITALTARVAALESN